MGVRRKNAISLDAVACVEPGNKAGPVEQNQEGAKPADRVQDPVLGASHIAQRALFIERVVSRRAGQIET
jgi:hypothetical protein